MVAPEKVSGNQSISIPSSENMISMDVQSVMEEGLMPKIRKPYTMTKQRERWTEEEHEKFVEALKLHGRAWRKIEEHLGTKTAIQIRSHAQKFFSKVVRETNNSNASSTEPIEIPPPRPKRKPSHPYPRKLVLPTTKEAPVDQTARSTSPVSSMYEQPNQSPTSVLSGSASDTLVSAADSATLVSAADLATPNDTPSPVSGSDNVNEAELLPSDYDAPQDDVPMSPSAPVDKVSVKLELFPTLDSSDKPESASPKVLKLFGKDVVVPSEPSNISRCLSKSPSSDMGESVLQTSIENFNSPDIAMQNAKNPWDCQTSYYVDGNGNHAEKPTPLPWWVFFQGIPDPPFECHVENAPEKESQREGSCEGSSSESAVGNTGNNSDTESRSGKKNQCSRKPHSEKKSTLFEKGLDMGKTNKGFVPYKRCFSQRDTQSSNVSMNEEDGRRTRLCL